MSQSEELLPSRRRYDQPMSLVSRRVTMWFAWANLGVLLSLVWWAMNTAAALETRIDQLGLSVHSEFAEIKGELRQQRRPK